MGRFLKIKSLNFERTLGLVLSTGVAANGEKFETVYYLGPKWSIDPVVTDSNDKCGFARPAWEVRMEEPL